MKEVAYIWGAAEYGKRALEYCDCAFDIVGFIDKRAGTEIEKFCAKSVISPQQFTEERKNTSIIIAVRYPAEVVELIIRLKWKAKIYIFDGRNEKNPLVYEVKNGEICISEYMNKRYAEWDEGTEHYSKRDPLTLNMFQTAIDWIRGGYEKSIEIYEMGCGSGQFANMLFDNDYTNYIGIDFSSEAIKIAKGTNLKYADKFICADIFSYLGSCSDRNGKTLFVTFEVLEHINKDIELLNMLFPGSHIIFSVPNFKSFNHMRVFDGLESIRNRYEMLNILNYLTFPANSEGTKIYHLIEAAKK